MAVIPFDASQSRMSSASAKSKQLLAGFTPGQKAITVIGGALIVIIGYFFMTHSSSPSYVTLYANLQPNQAGEVTQKLSSEGIPYQLQDGGSTVLVPAADVNQERITLAEAGLPSGGTITFQTLASTGITSSQFVQNVDYQQALEGQLTSTIESIQGIQSAQISLVLPNTSTLAIGNTQTPTASVLVNLATGTVLDPGQVEGIVNLVASAVPSLTPSNVTVVDNNGDILSTSGANGTASSEASQTTAYDNQLGATLTALLAKVVGQNNAAVQVHAQMNFNQVKTTTNGFEVGKNGKPILAPTSQNATKQTYKGNGSQASGVLGSITGPNSTNQNGNYSSTQSQISNAVGSVTQVVQQAPGQVQSTAVAVLVNSTAVKPAQLAAIKSLVATAAGLNLAKGNTIVVTSLPFAKAPQSASATKASMTASLMAKAPELGMLILIVLMFFLSLRSAKKRKPVFETLPMAPLSAATSFEPPTSQIPAVNATGTSMLTAAGSPVTGDVDSYIQSSPDEVAQLMRTWSQENSAGYGA